MSCCPCHHNHDDNIVHAVAAAAGDDVAVDVDVDNTYWVDNVHTDHDV